MAYIEGVMSLWLGKLTSAVNTFSNGTLSATGRVARRLDDMAVSVTGECYDAPTGEPLDTTFVDPTNMAYMNALRTRAPDTYARVVKFAHTLHEDVPPQRQGDASAAFFDALLSEMTVM